MSLRFGLITLVLACCGYPLHAQETEIPRLRQSVDVFAGVLEEALELDGNGLFAMGLGGVEAHYLMGQGVVVQVRTPLANRRNRLNLASLTSTIQSMAQNSNPFAGLRRTLPEASSALAEAAPVVDDYYQAMMDRIASVDFSLVTNTAISQAAEYTRSLRSLGSLDESALQELSDEVDSLRKRSQAATGQLRQLQQQLRSAVAEAEPRERLSAELDELLQELEGLRDQAVGMAQDLRQQNEAARRQYADDWAAEVRLFEERLFAVMCDYGASLRELPTGESIAVILRGLGEPGEEIARSDKIHLFAAGDLRDCQSGVIDAAELGNKVTSYSF